MPDTHGWVDRGPTKRPRPDDKTRRQVKAVIKQGVEKPRELTPEEGLLAFRNQVAADKDLERMEKWAADGCCVTEGNR